MINIQIHYINIKTISVSVIHLKLSLNNILAMSPAQKPSLWPQSERDSQDDTPRKMRCAPQIVRE